MQTERRMGERKYFGKGDREESDMPILKALKVQEPNNWVTVFLGRGCWRLGRESGRQRGR